MTTRELCEAKRQRLRQGVFIECLSDATAQGKSITAQMLCDYCDDAGVPNVLVKFETSRVAATLREGDVHIATEEIARAEGIPGGIVGLLAPALAKLSWVADNNGVMIFDWPGGAGQHRLTFLVAAQFNERLKRRGMRAISFVLTTALSERIQEASRILKRTAEVAPDFRRVLVLNEVAGEFPHPENSAAYATLAAAKKAASDEPVLLKKIGANAWSFLRPSGLGIRQVIDQEPEDLAAAIGADEFVTAACVSAVSAWYGDASKEIARILPFLDSEPSSAE